MRLFITLCKRASALIREERRSSASCRLTPRLKHTACRRNMNGVEAPVWCTSDGVDATGSVWCCSCCTRAAMVLPLVILGHHRLPRAPPQQPQIPAHWCAVPMPADKLAAKASVNCCFGGSLPAKASGSEANRESCAPLRACMAAGAGGCCSRWAACILIGHEGCCLLLQ